MPYCRRKCPYCDFFKKVPQTGERERFVQVLAQELELAAKEHPWASGAPATVYFGGGTPSLHTAGEIEFLLQTVQEIWTETRNPQLETQTSTQARLSDHGQIGGSASPDIEITLETNPGTVDLEKLMALHRAGVNRLSIGAQSFSARKLALLYRDHTAQETRGCVEISRHAGFRNVSLDLIFGLPGETLEEWRQDIYHALDMNPEHVSLYNLEFHAGTVFERWRKTGRLSPLDEDLEAEMYLITHEMLAERGYEHYEVSNFARPGFRSVHNSAYWKGAPYLGVGPSAHYFDGQRLRFENVSDMHQYFRLIEDGKTPLAKSDWLDEATRKEDWIALQLRKSEGIRWEDAKRELGDRETQELRTRAVRLPEDARMIDEKRFSLTPAGWFRENSVVAEVLPDKAKLEV